MGKFRTLALAVRKGSVDDVKEMLPRADVDAVSDTGLSPILVAVGDGEPELRVAKAELLLDAGADPTVVSEPEGYGVFFLLFSGRSHDFVAEGSLVHRLVDAGADINARDRSGRSALVELMWSQQRYSSEVLAPLYDAIFELDNLQLTTPADQHDRSVLEVAELIKMTWLLDRIEAYLAAHPELDTREG